MSVLQVQQQFVKISELPIGEYEQCTFDNCNFSEVDFTSFKFIDCYFRDCNLSLAKLNNTALRGVKFESCKLVGLHFENANSFGMDIHFKKCNLESSCFHGLSLKGMNVIQCQLRFVDFSQANLERTLFKGSDLTDAVFDRTRLSKSDFRSAFGIVLDPTRNNIIGARFDKEQLPGLLVNYKILVD